MRILLAASSGGNPSALATALIALGGAVVGGLITAGGQLIVEGRRAAHERELERGKAQREAEVRERDQRTLLRTAARLLLADLTHVRTIYAHGLSREQWWPQEVTATQPHPTPEDLRLLAAHLGDNEWEAVAVARSNIDTIDLLVANTEEMSEINAQAQQNLEATISQINAAVAAIKGFAEQAD